MLENDAASPEKESLKALNGIGLKCENLTYVELEFANYHIRKLIAFKFHKALEVMFEPMPPIEGIAE